MKEITDIFIDFFDIMRTDILAYFQRSYSYLNDLITYKKIDLNKSTDKEREKTLITNLKKMLKAIKTGLNTIGVSMDKLKESEKNFMELLTTNKTKFQDYNTYFQNYLTNYVNKILFEILIEYLLEVDIKKLENAKLFDLLPPYFISKLDDFKNKHLNSPNILKLFEQQNFENYINFKDLTLKLEESSRLEILTQLREAKKDIIKTLETPKKELIKSSILTLEKISIPKEKPLSIESTAQKDQDININLDTGTFLDYFGRFSPINPDIISRLKIEKVNIINSKGLNQDFFDLENLYYYISILKMLNLEFPFTNSEIVELVKRFINKKLFSSSVTDIPDSINNFYGLALFLELNLIYQTDIIDIKEIETFLKRELDNFNPAKLELNLFSILCLKLLGDNRKIKFNRNSILELHMKTNPINSKNFSPSLDIYNYLALLKLLDKNINLTQFISSFTNEIKKLLTSNGSVKDLITESARSLLIFDLLNIKDQESELCTRLLNYILNSTNFFNTENLNRDFNWRNDKLGFKIELEILYWALLACSRYFPLNQ